MLNFYEVKRIGKNRYQYAADGVIMGERPTIMEAIVELEKLQQTERGERHGQGKTTRL